MTELATRCTKASAVFAEDCARALEKECASNHLP